MRPAPALFCLTTALASCLSTAPVGRAPVPLEKERLAECLTRKGAHLYGASWCHWCHVQLEMFGPDAALVPYTDCEPNMTLSLIPECVQAGFTDETPLPTWLFKDGSRLVGRRSLQVLALVAGCPYP